MTDATIDTIDTIGTILSSILSINSSIRLLPDVDRERARQDRDSLVEKLAEITRSNWVSKVRLTLVDSNAKFHSEEIVFRNPDGSVASPEDVVTANHVLVMPKRENYTAADLANVASLIKLDQQDVEWMPIMSQKKFLILRFNTGRMYIVTDSYGIRALAAAGSFVGSSSHGLFFLY
jgi:hypothetical protein